MKLIIILGNGFDLNLGLNTRYIDFYDFFITQESLDIDILSGMPIPSVHTKLFNMIKEAKDDNWSDLEEFLGDKIKLFSDVKCLQKDKSLLENRINEYLERQQRRISFAGVDPEILRNQLDSTIERLTKRYGFISNNYEVTFLTFNYTDVIDRVIKTVNQFKNGNRIEYKTPIHIHGEIGKTLILGVDNIEQYELGKSNLDIDELKLIMEKPLLNQNLHSSVLSIIKQELGMADNIIIYGASIGKTDATWWKTISKCLFNNANVRLLILAYINGGYPSTATTKTVQLKSYKEKFEEWINTAIYDSICDRIAYESIEEWMFSIDFTMKSTGMFDNLIKRNT